MTAKPVEINQAAALVAVDIQNDFLPGGALGVQEGDRVVPVLNRAIELFSEAGALVYAGRDWHPRDHCSFKENGGPWPVHCVQGSEGARFHRDLKLPYDAVVISKAAHPDKEAYSDFEGTNIELYLRRSGVRRLVIGGLATDYCVKQTVLDACRLGFETYVLLDACRGIDVKRGDSDRALQEMKKAGAVPVTLRDLKVTS